MTGSVYDALCRAVASSPQAEALAFVVLRPGVLTTAAALQAHAAQRLADFKVPRAYHFTRDLPVGKTGKVDKAALPARLTPPG
jgi:acyl-coenzyme A synthetase/AMP-(fatty) acid ligase